MHGMENAIKTYFLNIPFVLLYRGADSGGRCKIIFWERISKLCASHFCQQTTLLTLYLFGTSRLYIWPMQLFIMYLEQLKFYDTWPA